MIYKTPGIIIRRTNLGEADKIITIITEKLGKIRAVAKGIRKIRSKISGNLELFCLSNLNIVEGRNLDVVTGAEIVKCYFNIRNNLKATHTAQYFGELIEKLTEKNDSHPEIFCLLDDVLDNMNNYSSDLLIPYFEWNLLSYLGYHPELYLCSKCRIKLCKDNKIYFSYNFGGIVCENCKKNDIFITTQAVKVLRLFLSHKISSLNKIILSNKISKEIKNITRTYLIIKSEKDFKSQRFLN